MSILKCLNLLERSPTRQNQGSPELPPGSGDLLLSLKLPPVTERCWNPDLTREADQRWAPRALRPPQMSSRGDQRRGRDVQPPSAAIRGDEWSRSSRSSRRILHADKILFTSPTPHESFRLVQILLRFRWKLLQLPRVLGALPCRCAPSAQKSLHFCPRCCFYRSQEAGGGDSNGLRWRRHYPQHPSSLRVVWADLLLFSPIRSLILGNGASITNRDSILTVLSSFMSLGPCWCCWGPAELRNRRVRLHPAAGNIQTRINDSECISQHSEKQIFSSHF